MGNVLSSKKCVVLAEPQSLDCATFGAI